MVSEILKYHNTQTYSFVLLRVVTCFSSNILTSYYFGGTEDFTTTGIIGGSGPAVFHNGVWAESITRVDGLILQSIHFS